MGGEEIIDGKASPALSPCRPEHFFQTWVSPALAISNWNKLNVVVVSSVPPGNELFLRGGQSAALGYFFHRRFRVPWKSNLVVLALSAVAVSAQA